MRQRDDAKLTDLEGAVLGYIASQGAVTGYAVAREFAASPSEFWSGSAGAVYPLIQRLEARGLLTGETGARGRRAATWYSISPAGHAEMKAWLLDVDRAAGMGFDPLRTRMGFAGLLTEAERRRFLDAVTKKTAEKASSDAFTGDSHAGLNKSWFRMRLAWLRRLAAKR